MRKTIFITVLICIIFEIDIFAAEPMSFKDFITITDKALDALDEAEIIFSRGSPTKKEAQDTLNKLAAATKKYDLQSHMRPHSFIAFCMQY